MNLLTRALCATMLAALLAAGPAGAQTVYDPPGSDDNPWPDYYHLPGGRLLPDEGGEQARVGGSCAEGSYGVLCESSDCIRTFWVFTPCRGETSCVAWWVDRCVWGVNGGSVEDWSRILLSRLHVQCDRGVSLDQPRVPSCWPGGD